MNAAIYTLAAIGAATIACTLGVGALLVRAAIVLHLEKVRADRAFLASAGIATPRRERTGR